jgi:ferredoxin--NADP+ reductase
MVGNSLLNATVVDNLLLSPGLFLLRVLPDAPIPDFKPGQYVALGLPLAETAAGQSASPRRSLTKRAYSIASSPSDKDALEFYIARVEDGALSPGLSELRAGDRLFVQKKFTGAFTTCEVVAGKNLILIATGTGIAPFISMLRTPEVLRRFGRITILHGVRYKRDLAYAEEITTLINSAEYDLEYFRAVSREEVEEEGLRTGYVQSYVAEGLVTVNKETDHVFLCGNPSMIESVVTLLTAAGFQEHSRKQSGNLHLENYW